VEAEFMRLDGVVIVELKGRLSPESTASLKKACVQGLLLEKIIFDLKDLNFVGSLGLKEFVDTMDQISQTSAPGVRLCGVSSEFRRLFEATGMASLGICNSRDEALKGLS
jgi:anti-anti-sigma factor